MMQTIYRNSTFLQKYALFYYFGIGSFLGGFSNIFVGENVWNKGLGVLFIGTGIFAIYLEVKRKKRDFIAWDDEKIVVQEPGDFPREFKFSEMEKFSVSPWFLVVKTHGAREISVDLRNYKREDVEKLRVSFA